MKSMIRKSLFSLLMITGFGAVAQVESPARVPAHFKDPLAFTQSLQQGNTSKTTATTERVIAQVLYHYDGPDYVAYDSTEYEWSAGKGSVQGVWNVSMEDFANSTNRTLSFDTWYLGIKVMRTYNSSGKIIEDVNLIWDGIAWAERNKTVYTYSFSDLIKQTYSDRILVLGFGLIKIKRSLHIQEVSKRKQPTKYGMKRVDIGTMRINMKCIIQVLILLKEYLKNGTVHGKIKTKKIFCTPAQI